MTQRQINILAGLGLLDLLVIGMIGFVIWSTTVNVPIEAPIENPLVETPKTEELRVLIDLSVELTDKSRAVLFGKTNLPDDTIIMVSVEQIQGGFHGQEKVEVDRGSFKAGPFGSVDGLSSGEYLAEVLIPYPLVQPNSVRAVIGENGERLAGDLVVYDDTGPRVELVEEFNILHDASANTQPPPPKPTALDRIMPSEDEYRQLMPIIAEGYSELFTYLGRYSRELDRDPSLLYDEDWKSEMAALLAYWAEFNETVRVIVPPSEFSSIHSYLEDAANHFDHAIDLCEDAINNSEREKFEEAAKEIELGSAAVNLATEELRRMNQ